MPQGPFPGGTVPGFPALFPTSENIEDIGSGGAVPISFANLPGKAVGTVTLSGSSTNGNTANATVNGVLSSVTAASDTLASLATKLATAINTNSGSIVTATANGAVVTITSIATGGNGYYTLTASGTGGTVATASYSTLELPNVVVPFKTFSYVTPGGTGPVMFYYGMPQTVDAATKADLRSQGLV